MKPIEPGCVCLSIDSQLPGECVANHFVPGGTSFPTPIGTCHTISDGWSVTFSGRDLPCMIATRHLLRIDGVEDESVTERQGEEVEA